MFKDNVVSLFLLNKKVHIKTEKFKVVGWSSVQFVILSKRFKSKETILILIMDYFKSLS